MWPLTHRKGQVGKALKNQTKVELTVDTPPICRSRRDAQDNLQQGWEILAYGREDEIVNLRFTHDSAKFFDSRA